MTLLLVEGALQAYFRLRHRAWLWENTAFRIGYAERVADRRQYALRPNYVDPAGGITINAWGFRGPVVPKNGRPLMVALGDSVPFGAGVRDDETYPAVADTLVASALPGARVVNAGVPSYNVRQSFDRLRNDVVPHYERQVAVVTLQAANDVSLLTWYRDAWSPDVTWAGVWWARSGTSAIPHYVSLAAGRRADMHRPHPGTAMLAHLRQTLGELTAFCESRGIRLILLPVDPFYYQTANRDRNPRLAHWRAYQQFVTLWDALIRDVNTELALASKNRAHVVFFDTRPVLDNADRNAMYLDYIHYTPAGGRMIAKALLDFMHTRGILDDVRRSATRP